MKNIKLPLLITILAPLVSSFAFALDIYIPVVPHMVKVFNSTPSTVQLTLTLFMLVFALGQLVVGPFSDQAGRMKIATISTIAFILSALLCVTAQNITQLIIYRIIQGISACGNLVVSLAIVRDLYEGSIAAKAFSYLNGTISASPIFAPIIGGYLAKEWDWRSNFIFLAILGVFSLVLIIFCLCETHPKEKRLKVNRAVFCRYKTILKNKQFLGYALACGFAISMFFSFFSVSSYLLISILHIPLTHFGYYFATMGIGFCLGSGISGMIVDRLGIRTTVLLGSTIAFFSGLAMLLFYIGEGTNALAVVIPVLTMSIGGSLVVGSAGAGALMPFGEMAGTASALLGCGQFLMASLAGSIVVHGQITSPLPLSICFVVSAGLAWVLVKLLTKD